MACPLSVRREWSQQARPVLYDSLGKSPFVDYLLLIRDRTLQLHVNLYKIDELQMIFLWPSRNANDVCSVEKIMPKVMVYCPVGR